VNRTCNGVRGYILVAKAMVAGEEGSRRHATDSDLQDGAWAVALARYVEGGREYDRGGKGYAHGPEAGTDVAGVLA